MHEVWLHTSHAIMLIISADAALWEIIFTSLRVSTSAILIATLPCIIIGFCLSYFDFAGRRLLISVFNTLMAVPAVVVGLVVFMLLSRQGPFGDLKLLFTQSAMIIAQIFMAIPILVSFSHAAFQSADIRAFETTRTFGLSSIRCFFIFLGEVKFGIYAAFIAAYGRILAEIGASLMVGGNILHYTRNITTAIGLETSKGNFAQGIALGIILLLIALGLNLLLTLFQGKGSAHLH